MSRRPVQVYLDSNDYSTLSDPRTADRTEAQETLRYLRHATREGTIDIRFSIVHIVEACHRGDASKPLAVARVKLIAELSGPRVMRHPGDIVADEVAASRRAGTEVVEASDNNGRWFPRLPSLGRDVRRAVEAGIQEGTDSVALNRKARRATRRLVGTRERPGPVRRSAFGDAASTAALCERYGMSERFVKERLFTQFTSGRTSDIQLASLVESEVFEPVRLVEHYLDRLERNRGIRNSVRSLGERMIDGVQKLRDTLDDLRRSTSHTETKSFDEARAGIRTTMADFRRSIIEAAMRAADMPEASATPPWLQAAPGERFMGVDALASVVEEWLVGVVGGAKHSRVPLVSDAGDLLHAFYIPYVDVWRGDRYARHAVRHAARLRGTEIAPSLGALVDCVERVRMRRDQSI
jgi:ketosteroid isomerase-like protein